MPGTGQIHYIVGAGITGLTLALALARSGATVVVLERGTQISEFGAGLQVTPNARRILDNLGLGDAIAERSLEPAGIDIYPTNRKAPLVTLELGGIMRERFGAPYAVMHRADLADALYKACRRFANIDIMFGVRGWDAVSHARGVTLTIDEADGQTRTMRGHSLTGADGVHSLTRRRLIEGPEARYFGRSAWRALIPMDRLTGTIALDRVSVIFGPSYHVVCYPLPHRGQVNIALFAAAPEGITDADTAPTLGRIRDSRVNAILAAAGDGWTAWPLYTVETPHWSRDNIGIVGDAAHAMVPFQAQGAAMGIEDAAVLAPLLIAEPTAEAAFARYAALRQQRVSRVARQSIANGRIFHLPWPLSVGRNAVIAAQGDRGHINRLAWLYSYDANAIQTLNPTV